LTQTQDFGDLEKADCHFQQSQPQILPYVHLFYKDSLRTYYEGVLD
jgi:hypothetical protein